MDSEIFPDIRSVPNPSFGWADDEANSPLVMCLVPIFSFFYFYGKHLCFFF